MAHNTEYFLFIILPLYLLMHSGLYGIFKKAGEDGWKAFVPILNLHVWLKLVGRPNWWLALFLLPVINFIIGITITLDLVRSFRKHQFGHHAAAVLVPFGYFIYLGFNKTDTYAGKWMEIKDKEDAKKSGSREWLDAFLFAGTAALLIRAFLIEAFMIPTTSMEGSLKAGDFLFVSKVHYGLRLPQVPLSMPFVHNRMPVVGGKSYLNWIELPYARLPALKSIERYDIVVFNYPDDDEHPDDPSLGPIHEVSMKQNYIKRCIGIPGDSIMFRHGDLYVNGELAWKPEHMQMEYQITSNMSESRLVEEYGFRADGTPNSNLIRLGASPAFMAHMDEGTYQKLSAIPGVKVTKIINEPSVRSRQNEMQLVSPMNNGGGLDMAKNAVFPKRPDLYAWTVDHFGPIYIPKAGATVKLDKNSLPFYRKIIDVYEDNELEVSSDGKIYINGQQADSYTFKMNYYFMVGDNRHQSLDSRYWGYVPEDHIVGRPWFVLFSWEGGPRWDRFFAPIPRWEP